MSVYVDELRNWGSQTRGPTSHLTADSVKELHAFAREHRIPQRLHHRGSRVPHYDLGPLWRRWALLHGASFVPAKEQARRRASAREGVPHG